MSTLFYYIEKNNITKVWQQQATAIYSIVSLKRCQSVFISPSKQEIRHLDIARYGAIDKTEITINWDAMDRSAYKFHQATCFIINKQLI